MSAARIVVVDDAPANLLLLANVLQEKGYEVRVANSAQRALTLIGRQPPDLILLDVNLPDRDGYSVCEELKRTEALQAIPVIFLSAHDDAAARRRGFEAGAAEYIAKPFEAAEVLARVGLHLRLARAVRETEALRADLSLWRARAETTFTALCATLPSAVFDSRYRLDARLSGDPHGALFEAMDLTVSEAVTIRVLPPAPGRCAALIRFRDASARPSRVSHPNIAEIVDCGVSASQGIPYTVTAPRRGMTLRDRLDRDPHLDPDEARTIAFQVAEALQAVHGAGGVHGNLRPENVFIEAGERPVVVLLDCGIAVIEDDVHDDRYSPTDRRGPQRPEVMADIYALGILIEELFGGGTSPALAQLVDKAKDPDPSNRPSAAELAMALSSRSR